MHKPNLLLHACCGPCATVCVERLLPDYEVALLWYNPNIQPPEEYERRLEAARAVAEHFDVDLVVLPPEERAWRRAVSAVPDSAAQPEGGKRCLMCLRFRLARAAREAEQRGFPFFDTTLSVSPHKDLRVIRGALRQEVQERDYALNYPHQDYRANGGFQRSLDLSRELGLFRQNYCGCLPSRREE
jgi:predicted adenine nucleotide alpha hydrolase (AANH) superfamily ATPase